MSSVRILILSEQMRGTSFALSADQYTIGRAESCDICISDPTISGHHCTLLKLEADRYAVRDEGSTNGTKVNEAKVTTETVPLSNGDILQIGGVEVLFDNRQDNKQESRTMTVINLEDTGTSEIATTTMKNLGAKIGAKKGVTLRENQSHTKVLHIVLGILGLLVLVGLGFLLTALF
ncbi:MAG: FHA domain-containing protein [Oligosphaeraceae bacterium]|nr:FHA domain-containing protein [Oligosphaeraceae bacterium]